MIRAVAFALLLAGADALSMKSTIATKESSWDDWGPNYLQLHSAPTAHRKGAMFCMVPKVACTEFLALMMRMHGLAVEHWNPTVKEHGGMNDVHFDGDREAMFFKRDDEGWMQLTEIMDPSNDKFTRAVFVRDPVERFVSAYLSKIKAGSYLRDRYPANSTTEMVEMLEKEPIEKADPHFRAQSALCNLGHDDSVKYDFIGSFDQLNAHSREMVKKFSNEWFGGDKLADELLEGGWGPGQNQSLFGETRKERDGNGHEEYDSKTRMREVLDLHQKAGSGMHAAALMGVDLAKLYVSMGADSQFFAHRDVMAHVEESLKIRKNQELLERIQKIYAKDVEIWERAK